MNKHLQTISGLIQESKNLTSEEKSNITNYLEKADKELEITTGELNRTEKVKRTTAVLLEETIEELEEKRKAVEAQKRELEIESAMEKVRRSAMAMHTCDDLSVTTGIVFTELKKLGVHSKRCGVALLSKESHKALLYAATISMENDELGLIGSLDMKSHPVLEKQYQAWLNKESYLPVLSGRELRSYYHVLSSQFSVPNFASENLQQKEYGYYLSFSEGLFYAWTEKAYSENEVKILDRFKAIIALTFRRYLDLENAEAQTRKAQIEASLERVRSSSLAMHKSDELKEVVKVVFENLSSLGLKKMDSVNINIFHEGSKDFDLWLAAPGQDYTKNFRLPYLDHPIANDYFESVKNGQTLHKKTYGYEIKNEYFKYMFENSDNKYLPEERKELILNGSGYSVSAGIASQSAIFIHNYKGETLSDEDDLILIRFSKVFDQAYKRYLDLHKAERLMREAVKQASLDRVRGQVASMRSADDLQHITPLIWQELLALEIPFIRCGVFIMDEKDNSMQAYLSKPDGRSLAVLQLPFNGDEITAKILAHWRLKNVCLHQWSKAEFIQWIQSRVDEGQIPGMESLQEGSPLPEFLHLHFIPFLQGMLYVGSTQPLLPYELDSARSLAEAFSVAYARYEDFSKLEKAKLSIEATLTELKSAQSLLIQAEKMASLGELTAGIAHEIQNPLNFVNNFSEVNKELIEELVEEVNKGKTAQVKAIAEEIKDNEEKINHHGKRAEAIVKGMLQHSRTSSGQTESTDINKLADEYLRLAYHGLRAKNKSFSATLKTDYDERIDKINVIPQDIGRVVLNLITNAFYAVSEKKKQKGNDYEPIVTVSTNGSPLLRRGVGGEVQITVADNGNGIPQNILDKIFQPFFTTKPTGQGTGLGLSLAYDIVKAHGGELKVETKENEGATFIIKLPVT